MNEQAKEFLRQFESNEFPEEILLKYEPVELLSINEYTKTFLILNKENNKKIIAKCYDKTLPYIENPECNIMKDLHHKGLPELVCEYEDENRLFVLREYIEGEALDRYAANKELTEDEILNIVKQLCDILIYLHGQKQPIIHRDIKPSNIIIKDEKITLIDFGISRRFDEELKEDTLYFGTKGFAPPEQYGYAQTDGRADIYAVGILLLYLCTGSIDLNNMGGVKNKKIGLIIKKCTEFSPKDRYKTAADLKAALFKKGQIRIRLSVVLIIGLILVGIISLGAYKLLLNFNPPEENDKIKSTGVEEAVVPVSFNSSLIEQAVRQILHKSDDEQITEDELLKIDQLLIAGNKPSATIQEYYTNLTLFYQENGSINRGDISDISDIEKMPNLLILCLPFQQITDITPVKSMQKLEKLELNGNPVTDISPVSEINTLQTISLQETRVSDTSPLNSLKKLRYININGNRCDSYEFLKYVGDIEYLDLSFAAPEKVLPLLNGKKVKNFQFSYADLYSLSGFEKITELETLDVQKSRITDISAIGEMVSLTYVNLAENPIDDLSPLLTLPNLKRAEFSRDMEDKVEIQLKNADFDIAYR